MNFISRAWLYITRKKGKSILLFIVLLIMATFVLTALALGNASDTAQQNLRKSLGGSFDVYFDYSENNPYLKVEQVEGGTIMYSTQQIAPELVEQIRAIEGVKSCGARVESLTDFPELVYSLVQFPLRGISSNLQDPWRMEKRRTLTIYFRAAYADRRPTYYPGRSK